MMEKLLYRVNRLVGSLIQPTSEQAARFNNLAAQYDQILDQVIKHQMSNNYDSSTYAWNEWRAEIRSSFSKNLPLNFLSTPLLTQTMVFGSTAKLREKMNLLEDVYEKAFLKVLLQESAIGKPKLSLLKYRSSTNTIHQASHLASYKLATKKELTSSSKIIEWGGGYGCLARMIKKINKDCTYIILDLPEFCVLQYVYLSSIFGCENIRIIHETDDVSLGKINLMPSNYIFKKEFSLNTETFISNWALTESAITYQNRVNKLNYFNASNVSIGCKIDQNNQIIENTENLSIIHNQFLQNDNIYLVK